LKWFLGRENSDFCTKESDIAQATFEVPNLDTECRENVDFPELEVRGVEGCCSENKACDAVSIDRGMKGDEEGPDETDLAAIEVSFR
jgi:hypothetical protein